MFKALFTSATGMRSQQLHVDTIANNLANVNTTGFKRSQIDFQDLLYEVRISPGTQSAEGFEIPIGLQVGSGVRPVSTTKIFAQGDLEETSGPLDIAINGKGFFQIAMPDGTTAYTRDGAFRLNSDMEVVNAQGYQLYPPLQIPSNTIDIQVGADGGVSVIPAESPESPVTAGNIQLATFANPAGLLSLGGNLFAATASSGQATTGAPGSSGSGELQHGYLERSNVNVVEELIRLIIAQRAYEVNSKAIRSSDSMLEVANNLRM